MRSIAGYLLLLMLTTRTPPSPFLLPSAHLSWSIKGFYSLLQDDYLYLDRTSQDRMEKWREKFEAPHTIFTKMSREHWEKGISSCIILSPLSNSNLSGPLQLLSSVFLHLRQQGTAKYFQILAQNGISVSLLG